MGRRELINLSIIPKDGPVLIAGPTASGKSEMARSIATTQGGVIVNADAMQVYDGWRVLTARPSPDELATAPHLLYGHVPFEGDYSVGAWLRAVREILADGPRPIIVGGTGLYFRALTEGLAEIPATPPDIRAEADALALPDLLETLERADPDIVTRMDIRNTARVRRAWEVLRATGRPISAWQAETPSPDLRLSDCTALVVMPETEWLDRRISSRFDTMLRDGALDEARANLSRWDAARGAAKAIGASELIAHVRDEMTLEAARDAAILATRQFAKRQRTWFRARMRDWTSVLLP